MTLFGCTADLVEQLNGNGQKGMLQIDAPPVENFWLRHYSLHTAFKLLNFVFTLSRCRLFTLVVAMKNQTVQLFWEQAASPRSIFMGRIKCDIEVVDS